MAIHFRPFEPSSAVLLHKLNLFFYAVDELEVQARLATPAVPVCIVKLQQLMEVTTASILGNMWPQQADHTLKALCRFAFAPGKPNDLHLLSLNCLEKMAKLSSRADVRTNELHIHAAVEILTHLSTDYMADLRLSFCSGELVEVVDICYINACSSQAFPMVRAKRHLVYVWLLRTAS
ncbi:hypothetical protein LMH87_001159 [Akanthomyces muscarius]|uniref:Uncharacterized protein n=1 Tax=Akanthomyces muscarius TaxID=2231603 RepID=A0A9W8QJB6_AKAMU|nr:hypothetical protein LMH87_001159 [Akanthomyces muscarius]KAJ4155938.1 hypothetical protein LMH87_001159 [Akanthomyces muscarius]